MFDGLSLNEANLGHQVRGVLMFYLSGEYSSEARLRSALAWDTGLHSGETETVTHLGNTGDRGRVYTALHCIEHWRGDCRVVKSLSPQHSLSVS